MATLATIILLMYTLLLQSVTDILAFAILKYPDGSYKVVWRPDGSVDYFRGKHIPLFLVAVAILTIGLAYTCVLFAWQVADSSPQQARIPMDQKHKTRFLHGCLSCSLQAKISLLDWTASLCSNNAQRCSYGEQIWQSTH